MTAGERLYQRGYQRGLSEALRERGTRLQKQATLLDRLSERFDVIPDPLIKRILDADIEPVDLWLMRLPEALTVDAVFAD